tara:strand:+ start:1964 stop:2518 length:555 start_codon:yes stop_codon:yes gene_type:complete
MAQDSVLIEINKQNLIDINLMFKKLPEQLSDYKTWTKFWRYNTKPLIKEASENAAKLRSEGNDQLAKSIGFFQTKASRYWLGGYVGPRVRGVFANKYAYSSTGKELKGKKQYTRSGFYGAFVEYGGTTKFGGRGTGENQPFMKNAFDSKKGIIIQNGMKDAEKIFDRALKIHAKRLKKYGTLGY